MGEVMHDTPGDAIPLPPEDSSPLTQGQMAS
jgi:hypothetical protein